MASKQKGYEQQKVGYKNPPKANQWKAGQSGNPSGKKKAAKNPPVSFKQLITAVLNEPTEIMIAGKKQKMPVGELLMRKVVHNVINAPLNQQVAAMTEMSELGLLDLANDWSDLEECHFDPFTEEHRRLLEITREELRNCPLDD